MNAVAFRTPFPFNDRETIDIGYQRTLVLASELLLGAADKYTYNWLWKYCLLSNRLEGQLPHIQRWSTVRVYPPLDIGHRSYTLATSYPIPFSWSCLARLYGCTNYQRSRPIRSTPTSREVVIISGLHYPNKLWLDPKACPMAG